MNIKRLRLVALCLSGVLLVVFGIVYCRQAPDPVYQGKRLSEWFKIYGTGGRPATFNSFQIVNGRPVSVPGSPAIPDPSAEAIQKIGADAVPFLIRRLRNNRFDRFYQRSFTNFPVIFQKRLPNPAMLYQERINAIDAITKLGLVASDATPALIELLYQGDPRIQVRVVRAVRQVHGDGVLVVDLAQRLAREGRDDEVVTILSYLGWREREMALLLGKMLESTNATLRLDTVRLLERGGANAAPAASQIIATLNDTDPEIRYLAARSLEVIGTNAPARTQADLQKALLAHRDDRTATVSNVIRRTLILFEATGLPSPVDN